MAESTFGEKVFEFYKNIQLRRRLPGDIDVMNPYRRTEVLLYVQQFLKRFFSDSGRRVYVLGINPGRFGAGLTGVTFTDPVALEQFCGISNTFEKRRELSSEFVYQFIESWGGVKRFYQDFFLTAVSPLGFISRGKNYNYYEDQELFCAVEPFIVDSLKRQLACGAWRHTAILFGTGKNQEHFAELNAAHRFFKTVYAIEHPRFIMQYQRRRLPEYLEKYNSIFSRALLENSNESLRASQVVRRRACLFDTPKRPAK